MGKNILVAVISILKKNNDEKKYKICLSDCDIESVEAVHTNEVIVKSLVELKKIKETGGLNKIIALSSNKVLNDKENFCNQKAIEYYKDIVKEKSPETEVVVISIEDDKENPREIHKILEDLCKEISPEDTVYIDSAGGRRTTNNTIQLLIKLMKYQGINNPYTLYADINGPDNTVGDTVSFDKMTDLLDAFNDFMTTGNSDKLSECFKNETKDEKINRLLKTMGEFSDKFQLGDIDNLETVVEKLKECIENCNVESRNIETVVLKQFLPVIKEKLLGDGEIDYIKIIKWCLENKLVQQALTIYVEKIPIYLFEKGIITLYCDKNKKQSDYESRKKAPNMPKAWQVNEFYTEILKEPLIKEFKNYLNEGKSPEHKECKKAVDSLKAIKNNWKNGKKSFDIGSKQIPENNYKDFESFKNSLLNNEDLQREILGMNPANKDKNLEKLNLIEKFKDRGSFGTDDCIFKFSSDKVADVYYGYIYVKFMRNKTNHASSDECAVSDECWDLLEKAGYKKDFSFKTIQENIKKALKNVADADLEVKPVIEDEVIEENIVPTEFKKGDTIDVICTDKKKVKTESQPYEIQLVINRFEDADELINKKFQAKIKQISKEGRIVQVEKI